MTLPASEFEQLNLKNLVAINVSSSLGNGILSGTVVATIQQNHGRIVRRLTSYSESDGLITFVLAAQGVDGAIPGGTADNFADAMAAGAELAAAQWSWPIDDDFTTTGASLGGVLGTEIWGLENETAIPELDIKVDSVAITANTKKLKAKSKPNN